MKFILSSAFIIMIFINSAAVFAQRDDFIDLKPFWIYHEYGSAERAEILNGYAKIFLSNPLEDDPSNCGIGQEVGLYMDFTYRARVKTLTDLMPGTRGWGMWLQRDWTDGYNWAAWFIEQNSPSGGPSDNFWNAMTVNGSVYTVQYQSLEGIIDNHDWHMYEIKRTNEQVDFFVDQNLIWQVTTNIPDQIMGERSWNDNLNYYPTEPFKYGYYGWTGTSSHVVDFMEVYDISPAQSISPYGSILLRELPNEIGTGQTEYLWKEYSYTSSGGNTVIIITARAEQYINDMSDDDDIKIVIDENDYGWDTDNSFNGDITQSENKTLVFTRVEQPGLHNIKIYGDITPLLYDVTVIGSPYGNIILEDKVEQQAPGGNDYLWKEYNFTTLMNENVTIAISATANDNFETYDDDDIRIILDDEDFGWDSDDAFNGDQLYGEARLLVIDRDLLQGNHLLRIYADQTPTLHYVVIYGNIEDNPLPIRLSSFNLVQNESAVKIHWITESEFNCLGYNILKAESKDTFEPSPEEYIIINDSLIPGAGNSNTRNFYHHTDYDVLSNETYWYKLEDVAYNGVKSENDPLFIEINNFIIDDFILMQNYPNPFNLQTTISIKVKNSDKMKLNIFNANGQLIRNLFEETIESGYFSVVWDGCDKSGYQLSSGIYFYQLTGKNKTEIRKMILLK